MAEAGEHHVLELVDLVLDALIDARIGMAENVDPPGAHRVQVALAVEVLQPHAFTAADGDQRQLFVVLHLGAGVPEYGEVALHPAVVQAHGDSLRGELRSLAELAAPSRWGYSSVCSMFQSKKMRSIPIGNRLGF